ncbi:MAG: urea amidolyase related protein [Frankiales bacterium]|jgi:biotin-dependent carboxylase-like uncharacterized protein|nr:urea amidolyase related protein [Frankiales bacterium]
MMDVLEVSGLLTVQDLGRPGYGHWGVSPSGAADRTSLRLANRLVGNDEGSAALELTLGTLTVRARSRTLVAITGAPAAAWIDDRPVPTLRSLLLDAGRTLRLARPTVGLRTYLAASGGVAVPEVLGSRSTDTLSGLGPAPVQAGDALPLGRPAAGPPPAVDVFTQRYLGGGDGPLPVLLGPRADWFSADVLRTLSSASYRVTSDSNRVGVRLDGAALTRSRTGELAPEGVVRGAMQVPPSGMPMVFLSDHPVTGGYPVLAVLLPAAADRLAQLRPGDEVRFALVGPGRSAEDAPGSR